MLMICCGGPKKYSWLSLDWGDENLDGRDLNVNSFWLNPCVWNWLAPRGCSAVTTALFTGSCCFCRRLDWTLSKLFTIVGLLKVFNSRIGPKVSVASSNLVGLCLSSSNSIFGPAGEGGGRLKFGKGTATWTSNSFLFCLISAFWGSVWTNSLILPLMVGLKSDPGCDLCSRCLIITKYESLAAGAVCCWGWTGKTRLSGDTRKNSHLLPRLGWPGL